MTVEITRVGTRSIIQVVSPTGINAGFEPDGLVEKIISGFEEGQKLRIIYSKDGVVSAEDRGTTYTKGFSTIPGFSLINNVLYLPLVKLANDLKRFLSECLSDVKKLETSLEKAATENLVTAFLKRDQDGAIGLKTIRVKTFLDVIGDAISSITNRCPLETQSRYPKQIPQEIPSDWQPQVGTLFFDDNRLIFVGLGAAVVKIAAETMLDKANFEGRQAFTRYLSMWQQALENSPLPGEKTTARSEDENSEDADGDKEGIDNDTSAPAREISPEPDEIPDDSDGNDDTADKT